MPLARTQHSAYKTITWLCTGLLIIDVWFVATLDFPQRTLSVTAFSRMGADLLCILVLWRPRLIALLLFPVAAGFLWNQATIGLPLFMGALVVAMHYALRHVIAPALAIAAIIVPFGFGFQTSFERINTAILEVIVGVVVGGSARLVIRSQHRAEARLHSVEQENADIRDHERRLLAAELERVVRTEIAACRDAASANGVARIAAGHQHTQAFETIEKSARNVLADLRVLLDTLRSPGQLVSVPAPKVRRWWARPTVWLQAIATCYIMWRLYAHLVAPTGWQFLLVNVLALVVAMIALFRWRTAMWLSLVVVGAGALLSGTTWTALKMVVLIAFLAGLLRPLSGWRLGLVLLGIPALASSFFFEPFGMNEGAAFLGVVPGAVGYGIGQIMRIRAESVPLLRRLAQARPKIRTDERNTLARELHDVVAHQLSVVALQSMAYAHTASREKVTAAKNRITAALDTAEAELDLLVGELSQVAAASGVALSPRSLVGTLTEQLIANGFIPDLTVAREVDDLPASLQRTLSRALQESITNVLRYAPPRSRCSAKIFCSDSLVSLRVVSPLPVEKLHSNWSSGYGLRGIRERIDLQRGTFEAGPQGREWVVDIAIPISALRVAPQTLASETRTLTA